MQNTGLEWNSGDVYTTVSYLSLTFPCAEGQDYLSVTSQSVVFLPGAPAAHRECFTVTIIDDNIAEREEYFFLVIVSTSQGAVIGTSNETTVFITDNDGKYLKVLKSCSELHLDSVPFHRGNYTT